MTNALVVQSRSFVHTALGHVHIVQAGPRTGIPIVLMHQTPRSVDEFAEVIPLLAATRHVVAVDTPGYGCSDRPATQPTVADYAGVMVEVLDALGIPKAYFVGHHTGAIIAVELAAGHPERVAGVGLSGPVYTDAAGRAALLPFFKQWQPNPDGSHFTEKWNRLSQWTQAGPALVQRLVVDLFAAGGTSEFGHFAIAEYHMEDRLPLVKGPALVMQGVRDSFCNADIRKHFLDAFSPTREVLIEDAGVFLPSEAPEAFVAAVNDFLR